jgi:hypothetical protein
LSLLNRDFTEDGKLVQQFIYLLSSNYLLSFNTIITDYELLLALDENNVVPPSQGANEDELPPSSCLSEEKEQVLKMEQNNTCAICLESFQAGETVSTMCCGHIFHSEELERWLKLKAVCPVCKCSIKKEEQTEAQSTGSTKVKKD